MRMTSSSATDSVLLSVHCRYSGDQCGESEWVLQGKPWDSLCLSLGYCHRAWQEAHEVCQGNACSKAPAELMLLLMHGRQWQALHICIVQETSADHNHLLIQLEHSLQHFYAPGAAARSVACLSALQKEAPDMWLGNTQSLLILSGWVYIVICIA